MSTPRPSEADVEAIVEVIVDHQRIPTYRDNGQRCTGCDHLRDEPDGANSPRHARHVARQILASDWLAARDAEHEREVAALREAHRIGVELDNHHNADVCPYCTGDIRARAEAAEREAADLRGEIEALIQRAESGAGEWGACSHEWARIADLYALLSRDDAAGAGGAG